MSSTMLEQSSARASTRVRKQPETLYNSSPFTSSAKRKRSDTDDVEVPDDSESDSESAEEDDDDDEADEEELRERRARARKAKADGQKKPAQKKTKVNGATTLAIRPAGQNKRKAPKSLKALSGLHAEEAGGLFAEVFVHTRDLQELVTAWCDSFAEHESHALVEIINFVLRAAGCVSKVTNHDVEDPDAVTDRIMDLQDEFQASNPTDYPLMAKGKTATTIKQGVTGFLDVLVKSIAQTGLLFENQELLENIQVWFSTMSTAANRPFRHTATVVSLGVLTSLCEVCRDVANEAAKSLRQAETERKKSSSNKARVKEIEQKAQNARQRQEFIEALLKDWFDTVFIHRYKDIDATIRRECAAALGDWIVIMPSVYFDGQHLRYVGWMLSDTQASVRMETVKQLLRLYRMPDMVSGLKAFTDRFRARFVEMATQDADPSVRTAAIELLDILRENGLLEPDDVDAIGRLIFESDDKVRKAVAKFLAEGINELYDLKIDELGGADALDEVLPEVDDDYSLPRLAWVKLKCLAETLQAYHNEENLPNQLERPRVDGGLVLHASGLDSRLSLAADDLHGRIPELSDWRLISGYLLFDPTSNSKSRRSKASADDPVNRFKQECALSSKEEIILLEALNVSVKHELVSAAEKLNATKVKSSKKHKAELQEEQEEAARDLALLVPTLLEKYGDLPETASSVLRLEGIFTSPLLKDLRHDSATYAALLEKIRRQFMSHTSDKVLEPATRAILHAKSYGELDEVTTEKTAGLWEDVISNFVQLIDIKTLGERGSTSVDLLTAMSANLLRIMRLSSVANSTAALDDGAAISSLKAGEDIKGPIDCILALILRAKPAPGSHLDTERSQLEDEVASRAAQAALFYTQWRFLSISERVRGSAGVDIPYDELEALATRRDMFSDNLSAVLQQRKGKDEICATLAGCLLELHIASATLRNVPRGPNVSDDYTVFIMDLDPAKQKEVMKAFAGAEQSCAKLNNKRLDVPLRDADDELDAETFDDDPLSDPESDDEAEAEPSQAESQAIQQRREARLITTLLAEKRLCELTGKIIHAVLGGIMDAQATRQRVERNKAKLGLNFKAACAYFDLEETLGKKSKAKASAKGKAKAKATDANGVRGGKGKAAGRRSNAIVAESEEEDDIEDDEDEEDQGALSRRGLAVDDGLEADADEGGYEMDI